MVAPFPTHHKSIETSSNQFPLPSAHPLTQIATSSFQQIRTTFSSCYRGTSLLLRSISKLPLLLAAPFIVAAYKCDSLIHGKEEPLLIRAAKEGKTLLLSALHVLGADLNAVDQDGKTLLHLAADANQLDTVKSLVYGGADLDAASPIEDYNYTPLRWAIKSGHGAIVDFLAKQQPKKIAKMFNSLINDHEPTTRQLQMAKILAENADAEAAKAMFFQAAGCFIPKGSALERDMPDITKVLLGKIGDLNFTNEHGETPLHCAIRADNLDIVKALVEKGADVNAANQRGDTPAHLAIGREHQDIFEFLVEKGANLKAMNKAGNTPNEWDN